MVKGYTRDGRADRIIDDVSSVELASYATLEYYVITALSSELKQCDHCNNFEKSQIYIILVDSF